MKKKSFIANLILTFMAFALCFASLFFVSCGSDADGGGEATVVVTLKNVRITGTAKVGETLTANATDTSGATGESVTGVTYQWLRSDTEDGEYSAIENATGRTYELTDSDKDKYIKVRATKNGSEESEPKGPVDYPKLSSVAISGTAKVGETLTASAKDTDGSTITAGITYSWLISDSVNGTYTAISEATDSTYVITLANAGKYIKVSATKEGITQTSSPTDAVSVTTIKTVKMTGTSKVGETLTAVATDTDDVTGENLSGVTYQWYVSDNLTESLSETSAITGATAKTYQIPATYVSKYLAVKATKNGGSKTYWTTLIANGTLSDSYVIKNGVNNIDTTPIVVTLADGSATLPELTVEGLKDATSTLDVSGGTATFAVASLTASKTLTITVVAPGYDSLTKDVFVTVKAEPMADGTLTLLSGEENQATILQGSVKFDLTGDNASKSGKYQFSIDSDLTWVTLTSENAEVSVGNTATSILVRVAPTGDAGIEGYIAPSESTSITIEDSNKGTKPSAGVKTVELSGDIAITQSENNLIFTADDGYTDYEWSFSEEVPTGTLMVSSDGKTATVDATKITVAGSYYLILTAKLNGHKYSGTVTIEK